MWNFYHLTFVAEPKGAFTYLCIFSVCRCSIIMGCKVLMELPAKSTLYAILSRENMESLGSNRPMFTNENCPLGPGCIYFLDDFYKTNSLYLCF